MKHYIGINGLLACGRVSAHVTTNTDEVTCQNCILAIGVLKRRPARPDTTSLFTIAFRDPLGLQPNQSWGARANGVDNALEQRMCDRLRLLVRHYNYPIFDDPTLPPGVVVVTRFDPHDMNPIERGDISRSDRLHPCIYTNGPEWIRWAVENGRPPMNSNSTEGWSL